MWELTLIYNKDKFQYLDYIYTKLAPQVKFVGGIIIKGNNYDRAKISIAVPAKQREYFVLMILELVSEVITQDYKCAYLDDNLGNLVPNELTRAVLVKALTVFDKQTDKDLIKKELVVDSEINIESFYHFKLGVLRARWQDICVLVKENIGALCASQSLDNLLKFLIKTCENSYDEVHIIKKNAKYFLCDSKSKPINIFGECEGTDAIKSLENIITLSPAKIVIDDTQPLKEPFYNVLYNLFEDRVCVSNRAVMSAKD